MCVGPPVCVKCTLIMELIDEDCPTWTCPNCGIEAWKDGKERPLTEVSHAFCYPEGTFNKSKRAWQGRGTSWRGVMAMLKTSFRLLQKGYHIDPNEARANTRALGDLHTYIEGLESPQKELENIMNYHYETTTVPLRQFLKYEGYDGGSPGYIDIDFIVHVYRPLGGGAVLVLSRDVAGVREGPANTIHVKDALEEVMDAILNRTPEES